MRRSRRSAFSRCCRRTSASAQPEPSALEVARNAARHDLGRLLDPQEEQDTRAEYLLRGSGMAGPGEAIVACARELESS